MLLSLQMYLSKEGRTDAGSIREVYNLYTDNTLSVTSITTVKGQTEKCIQVGMTMAVTYHSLTCKGHAQPDITPPVSMVSSQRPTCDRQACTTTLLCGWSADWELLYLCRSTGGSKNSFLWKLCEETFKLLEYAFWAAAAVSAQETGGLKSWPFFSAPPLGTKAHCCLWSQGLALHVGSKTGL